MSMDWRGTANSLSELADKFYSQPGKLLYSDVTFVLSDGSEVQAHKLILAWASPVFEMEFYSGEWVEHGRERLEIVDDRGVFRYFICYVYSQNYDLSCVADLQLWDLLYLANKYLVKQIQKMVEERLVNCMKTCKHKPDILDHWQRSREKITERNTIRTELTEPFFIADFTCKRI